MWNAAVIFWFGNQIFSAGGYLSPESDPGMLSSVGLPVARFF